MKERDQQENFIEVAAGRELRRKQLPLYVFPTQKISLCLILNYVISFSALNLHEAA